MTTCDGVWVVAACFNEEAVIPRFIERVLAVPGVDQLVLVDDGSRDATVETIRGFLAQRRRQGLRRFYMRNLLWLSLGGL